MEREGEWEWRVYVMENDGLGDQGEVVVRREGGRAMRARLYEGYDWGI